MAIYDAEKIRKTIDDQVCLMAGKMMNGRNTDQVFDWWESKYKSAHGRSWKVARRLFRINQNKLARKILMDSKSK